MMHNDLVSVGYHLQKLCEISLPLAKGQSAQDYVLAMEDYKILFHAQ